MRYSGSKFLVLSPEYVSNDQGRFFHIFSSLFLCCTFFRLKAQNTVSNNFQIQVELIMDRCLKSVRYENRTMNRRNAVVAALLMLLCAVMSLSISDKIKSVT